MESKVGSVSRIVQVERGERIPLSFAQQRLWFLARMGQEVSDAYHIPIRRHLKGRLDSEALRKALDRIVARHEALRTTFEMIDGEPVQRIIAAEESHFHLVEHDLRGRGDAQDELARLVKEEAHTAFDLEAGPLIRGRLIRQSDDEHALLITMHHIVSDGWSMGVLLKELSALYGAFIRGQADPLPALRLHYADYAVWQRKWIGGEILRQQAEYWKRNLAGAPAVLELPADHARPAQQDFSGDSVRLVLDKELAAGLKELSKRHGTTLYMTLMAGWVALLARLSGQTDVVIGMPVANRNRLEIEDLIGFFVNTLALRVDFSDSPTVGKLLERVKTQALAAQQHQDIPFEQVVEITKPVRSLAHSPLFQVMFDWQNAAEIRVELSGLEIRPLQSTASYDVAKFDLALSLQEAGARIVGGLDYATALFERPTVERYLGYFRRLLEGMVADDSKAVDCLPVMRSVTPSDGDEAVCIREGGTMPPLFLLHAINDCYGHYLAPYIDHNVPVYALSIDPPGRVTNKTIQGAASCLVRLMRSVQPAGPYRLAGHSLAGTIAYEVATQLIGADQEVTFVGLLDTRYYTKRNASTNPRLKSATAKDDLLNVVRNVPNADRDRLAAVEQIEPLAAIVDYTVLVQKCRELSLLPEAFDGLTISEVKEKLALGRRTNSTAPEYEPQLIPVPIDVFVAEGEDLGKGGEFLYWDTVLPQQRIRRTKTPGTHSSMMKKPNVEILGHAISAALLNWTANPLEGLERSYSPLQTLQSGRTGSVPLFCVPGAGDNVAAFVDLVGRCDRDLSIYAFQPRGTDGELVPHSTVLGAAELYVNAMSAKYPEGPVHLLGHSFGGWVVFEMARLLTDVGRTIGSITMLDSEAPDDTDAGVREYTTKDVLTKWIEGIELILERPLKLESTAFDGLDAVEQRKLLHEILVRERMLPRRSDPAVLRGPLRTFATSLRTRYIPLKTYSGLVHLIFANDSRVDDSVNLESYERRVVEWRKFAPNLASVRTPVNHFKMLKSPFADVLAQLLGSVMSGKPFVEGQVIDVLRQT